MSNSKLVFHRGLDSVCSQCTSCTISDTNPETFWVLVCLSHWGSEAAVVCNAFRAVPHSTCLLCLLLCCSSCDLITAGISLIASQPVNAQVPHALPFRPDSCIYKPSSSMRNCCQRNNSIITSTKITSETLNPFVLYF